jgi:hypothetical protein
MSQVPPVVLQDLHGREYIVTGINAPFLLGRVARPVSPYRDTSVTIKRPPVGPYRRPMPRVVGWSWGGGRFIMDEVLLYFFFITLDTGPRRPLSHTFRTFRLDPTPP